MAEPRSRFYFAVPAPSGRWNPGSLLPVDESGQVRCEGGRTIPLERAAAMSLSANCEREAAEEGLMPECHDVISAVGCSSWGGDPAVLPVGAVAALLAALRLRRRAIA
ncbi:hypothetical protein AKJ08_0474 [Vulgatibacter incomptus]|uniref:Uncharacterized protein n=2 Tax=Vulgatibacter incomptus TaxID=1391653 RepID=A0A0K1P9A2_9BACT|nr:hypothetical protein AKJ08_0474 [Vulgatibacter incomptus]